MPRERQVPDFFKEDELDTESRGELMLGFLVEKLSTMLTSPEESIVQQDDPSNEMFWITKGECVVTIREYDQIERVAIRLLVEG